MTYCANCGTQVEGRFCAKCGTPVAAAGTGAPPPRPQPHAHQATPGATPYGGQSYQPPPGGQPYSSGAPATGGLSDNLAAALSYVLGLITGIVFLVLAPYNQNKFVRFHAFQSIFLHGAWILTWIALTIISAAMPWTLNVLASLLWMIVALGGLAVWIIAIIKAYNHERFKLPIIGDLAEKQA